jgi:L-2-hydroxyglutarate oxidase LhgO
MLRLHSAHGGVRGDIVREPTIVIGGGLVGLATALALVRRGEPVVVCEKEPDWAQHQSGNNSGVVHSGIYYVPGSLKAEMARAASGELAAFCAEHDVAYRRTGKMIAATHAGELIRMRKLLDRGRANGVPVREITLDEAREREPHVSCVGALWVESSPAPRLGHELAPRGTSSFRSRGSLVPRAAVGLIVAAAAAPAA